MSASEQSVMCRLVGQIDLGRARYHGAVVAVELSTGAAERFPKKLLTDANAAFHSGGDDGAFYLPCCWETLAVNAARDHCCGILPHHRNR